MFDEQVKAELSVEEMDVLHWRIRRFLELEFNMRQARVLAKQHADWHEAKHMIDDGCSADVAFDILS